MQCIIFPLLFPRSSCVVVVTGEQIYYTWTNKISVNIIRKSTINDLYFSLTKEKCFKSSQFLTIIFHCAFKTEHFRLCASTLAGNRLAFSLGSKEIPKVNCPDYICTMGVIFWVNMAGQCRPTPSTFNSLFSLLPLFPPASHIYNATAATTPSCPQKFRYWSSDQFRRFLKQNPSGDTVWSMIHAR